MKIATLISAVTDPGQQAPACRGNGCRVDSLCGVDPDTDIGAIHYRAQDVRPGGLFIAVPGHFADGHDFVETAMANGAAAAVVQRPVPVETGTIAVKNTRKAMGELAARFYGNPSQQLFMIGITGTNGKTTTAYLIESVLKAAGFETGVTGTINSRYCGRTFDSPVTTPESVDLQRTLAEMKQNGVTHVVMEVSSHGIHQERIRGCRYDVGVFTNLTQDHLDFHRTMTAYWDCKQKLFDTYLRSNGATAVINCDDGRGRELAARLEVPTLTSGRADGCAVKPADERYDLSGITAQVATPSGRLRFRSPLVGRHNLENILCAAGVGIAMGISPTVIKQGIENLAAVPGRLEPVANDRKLYVFVDYAHTPDALENALGAIRSVTGKRIICVFGCGGDRDRDKRPMMGKIAGSGCHLAVVTSDNPRSESPQAIIDQIVPGIKRAQPNCYTPEMLRNGFEASGYTVEPDRRAAIELAVSAARPGDTILIAGKGHETYQIIGSRTIDFDDRQVAARALETGS